MSAGLFSWGGSLARATAEQVTRFDTGEIQGSATRTDEGYVRAEAVVTRTGVFLYQNPDGSIRRELRHPDDVFRADSLATLKLVPITDGHPPEKLVDAKTVGERGIGQTGENVRVDGRHVLTTLVINRADGVSSLERGRRELSLGYRADVIEESGMYNGERYDSRQTNIRYNHLALVDRGRAGATARVNLDADDAFQVDGDTQPIQQERTDMADVKLETVVLDGLTYQAAPEVARALQKANARLDEADDFQKRYDTLEADRDTLRARVDEFEKKEEDEDEEEEAKRADELAKAVQARLSLERAAAKVIGDEDVSKLSDRQLREKVILSRNDGLDLEGKSDVYVEARFDAIVEDSAGETSDAGREQVRRTAERVDGKKGDTVNDAREAHRTRLTSAWQGEKAS